MIHALGQTFASFVSLSHFILIWFDLTAAGIKWPKLLANLELIHLYSVCLLWHDGSGSIIKKVNWVHDLNRLHLFSLIDFTTIVQLNLWNLIQFITWTFLVLFHYIMGYIDTIVSFVWLANSKLKINKNTYIHIRVIITI